jgi:polynucleotide 5'-hydroxyl-kinase GRC3/NOL9
VREIDLCSLVCECTAEKVRPFKLFRIPLMFARYARVAFLNLDPGQSEFTPPGILSVHIFDAPNVSPAFASLQEPVAAHFLGSTTPLQDPAYYLEAARALVDDYRGLDPTPADSIKETSTIPLVINTCGWTKGKGGELLDRIVQMAEPTHHFSLASAAQSQNDTRIQLDPFAAPASEQSASRLSPANVRALSMLSYFHFDFSTRRWDFQTPLSARLPALCNWTTALSRVYIPQTAVPYEDALFSLNASVVGLVKHQDRDRPDAIEGFPYRPEEEASRPDPASSQCCGLAIVRSIDASNNTLALLSPVDLADKCQPDCLVLGQVELPVVAMYEDDVDLEQSVLPYLRTDDFAGGKRHIRRNLQRREQRA